jgi:IS30 family transposase
MSYYSRITKQERCLIEMGIKKNLSRRAIAKSIERSVTSVSKEIKKNGGYLGYYAVKAHYERAGSNRAGFSKIDANPDLANFIRSNLKRFAPEIIANKWNNQNDSGISHESIYTWIYKQDDTLYLQLPRKKKKRGLRPQRSKSKIPDRISIHQRPDHINDRSEVGHYEGDLVFQRGNQSQNIFTMVERKSRKVTFIKNTSKRSDVVIGGIRRVQAKSLYPMNTMTFDNGSEFTNHSELGVDTYFCDPGSPWQKGAIENVNSMLRQKLDYRIDINTIDQEMLDSIADIINNTPRKILGFLTPNEVFEDLFRKKLDGVAF